MTIDTPDQTSAEGADGADAPQPRPNLGNLRNLRFDRSTLRLRHVQVSFWLVAVVIILAFIAAINDGVDGVQKYAQFVVGGVAVGSVYSILVLGFVVVYKATHTFNLAQSGFVVLGSYVMWQFYVDYRWPFVLAVVVSLIVMAAIGMSVERVIMRKTLGKPAFSSLMVTLAIFFVLDQVVRAVWSQPGYSELTLPGDSNRVEIGGVVISYLNFWSVGAAVLILTLFFIMFERTRLGLSMKATAFDPEVASAQGVRIGRAYAVSWAVAAIVATVAGIIVVARAGGALTPAVAFVGLRAFPAMILGGLDSTGGAVAGGLIVGLAEVMVAGYLDYEWLGDSFETVVPYLMLLPILLWRPQGLLGTKKVERS